MNRLFVVSLVFTGLACLGVEKSDGDTLPNRDEVIKKLKMNIGNQWSVKIADAGIANRTSFYVSTTPHKSGEVLEVVFDNTPSDFKPLYQITIMPRIAPETLTKRYTQLVREKKELELKLTQARTKESSTEGSNAEQPSSPEQKQQDKPKKGKLLRRISRPPPRDPALLETYKRFNVISQELRELPMFYDGESSFQISGLTNDYSTTEKERLAAAQSILAFSPGLTPYGEFENNYQCKRIMTLISKVKEKGAKSTPVNSSKENEPTK